VRVEILRIAAAAKSEAPEGLFEAVEEGARVRLGHAVHVV
jgi:hypothetical protein